MKNYESGATRNSDEGKPQYAKVGDPSIDKAYAEYMNSQAVQADGKVRAADNWKKGIPVADYLDSMDRHFHDVWALQIGRDDIAEEKDLVTALCALKFNVDGMLYEVLKARRFEEAKRKNTEEILGALMDVTALGDANLVWVSGLPDASGDFTGFYDTATTQTYQEPVDEGSADTYEDGRSYPARWYKDETWGAWTADQLARWRFKHSMSLSDYPASDEPADWGFVDTSGWSDEERANARAKRDARREAQASRVKPWAAPNYYTPSGWIY